MNWTEVREKEKKIFKSYVKTKDIHFNERYINKELFGKNLLIWQNDLEWKYIRQNAKN